ncbi:YtpI family protein [Bacillus taeanensis]|uniref:YtpI-like protein n=1 Tax=Bacillus taeanensis TaxID=273032 RepID=A0A366Y0V8_9BACI|nr:YtpI family protein [Bacillus taeanensis]RBW71476.1 hypothetical protein DS031_01635 [Bacillus taeanensis]
MPVLVLAIILSASFYLFYKIKYVRTQAPAEKQWIKSKGNIALGVFLIFFAFNQLFLYGTSAVTIVISIIFLLLGSANVLFGYKAYRHLLPYAIKEAEENRN